MPLGDMYSIVELNHYIKRSVLYSRYQDSRQAQSDARKGIKESEHFD